MMELQSLDFMTAVRMYVLDFLMPYAYSYSLWLACEQCVYLETP
jgi:hypothetical protein